jgi:hypothetical protein
MLFAVDMSKHCTMLYSDCTGAVRKLPGLLALADFIAP